MYLVLFEQEYKGGLIDEVLSLKATVRRAGQDSPPDYTSGVYQSIGRTRPIVFIAQLMKPGFREFSKYLDASDKSELALAGAITDMKNSTRRYAKRQVSWIRNKLLPVIYAHRDAETNVPHVYLLDANGKSFYSLQL